MFGHKKEVFVPVGEGVTIELKRLNAIGKRMDRILGDKRYGHAVVYVNEQIHLPDALSEREEQRRFGLWVEAHHWDLSRPKVTLAFSTKAPHVVRIQDLHDRRIV